MTSFPSPASKTLPLKSRLEAAHPAAPNPPVAMAAT
jgi:hypothetical protein